MQEQTESFAEYRARSGVNWSALKHYAKSPAHYRAALANPPAQTPEMQTGSALHALVLEGEAAFASRYAIAPEGDKRRKEVKEAWEAFEAEHAGKEALTPTQNETVRRMAASLLEHPKVAPLLRRCTAREVMLRYRAASFFGRQHAPDILLGMYSVEEALESAPSAHLNGEAALAPESGLDKVNQLLSADAAAA